MTDERSAWAIHFTVPPDAEHKWTRNIQVTVIAATAERAIARLREVHADARIMQINHKGGGVLIVDGADG